MVPNSSPLLGYAGVVSWKLIKDCILNAISGTAQKVQSYLEWISNVPNLFIPGAKLTTRKTQETSRCCHYIPIILYRDSILIMHIIPPFLLVTSQLFMVLWPTLRFRCTGAGGGLPLVLYSKRKFSLVFSSERESWAQQWLPEISWNIYHAKWLEHHILGKS